MTLNVAGGPLVGGSECLLSNDQTKDGDAPEG